ncbi:MAG: IPT/TIG domain-containing protein, partial [Roseiflexaceae bacterium]
MLLAILLGLPMVSALANATPPTLSVSDTSTYLVGGSAAVVAPTLVISDDDNELIDGASVAITTNFDSSTDFLGISGTLSGVTSSYDIGTGVMTFSGTAPVSTYQDALRQVTFYTTGSPVANARTVQFSLGSSLANPDGGHFYEFISSSGIPWDTARDAAAAQFLFGLQGYLATVTSASESSFISGKVSGNGWIGASDAAVEGDWSWVTGPEAGLQFWAGAAAGSPVGGQYNNWDPGAEPNNAGGENYAHIIGNPALGADKLGRWNDLPISVASGSYAPLGYLVEYGGTTGDPMLTITDNATVNVVYSPAINTVSPGSGPTAGGTSVTINGANLSSATSVTFGGVSVPITSNSSTAIVVTVPAHAAGQVDVVVTTSTGT